MDIVQMPAAAPADDSPGSPGQAPSPRSPLPSPPTGSSVEPRSNPISPGKLLPLGPSRGKKRVQLEDTADEIQTLWNMMAGEDLIMGYTQQALTESQHTNNDVRSDSLMGAIQRQRNADRIRRSTVLARKSSAINTLNSVSWDSLRQIREKKEFMSKLHNTVRSGNEQQSHLTEATEVSSPRTAYISECMNMGIMPQPTVGKLLVKDDDQPTRLGLQHCLLGNQMATAVAASLPQMRLVDLNLQDNRLSTKGLNSVLAKLPACNQLKSLDLSDNVVRDGRGVSAVISSKRVPLVELNLANCQLTSTACIMICKSVGQSHTLKSLNLAQNSIGSKPESTEALCELLSKSTSIENVSLSWNQIRNQTAAMIADSLAKWRLSWLDLSWNALGHGPEINGVVRRLSESIKGNKFIQHLDLSYNSLDDEASCKELMASIAENESLQVVHMDGSKGVFQRRRSVDQLRDPMSTYRCRQPVPLKKHQSLHLCAEPWNAEDLREELWTKSQGPTAALQAQIFSRVLNDPDFTGKIQGVSWTARSHCWMCEKWVHHTFDFPADAAMKVLQDAAQGEQYHIDKVSLRLSSDLWASEDMELEGQMYVLTRKIPPEKWIQYSFQVHGEINGETQVLQICDRRHGCPRQRLNLGHGRDACVAPGETTDPPTSVNCLLFDAEGVQKPLTGVSSIADSLSDEDSTVNHDFSPSSSFDIVEEDPNRGEEATAPTNGLFSDYEPERPRVCDAAFEADWAMTTIPRMFDDSEDVEGIKYILSKHFITVKNVFKYYAACSPDVFHMSESGVHQFVSDTYLDDGVLTEADIRSVYVVSNVTGPMEPRLNPSRGLARFQLMDLLVRVALIKYRDPPECSRSAKDAIAYLLMKVESSATRYEYPEFLRRLRAGDVHAVFIEYMEILNTLFELYSGKFDDDGAPQHMSLNEFDAMATAAGLVESGYSRQHARLAYVYAMETQVNEMASVEHMRNH